VDLVVAVMDAPLDRDLYQVANPMPAQSFSCPPSVKICVGVAFDEWNRQWRMEVTAPPFGQADKGLKNTEFVVRDGGVILLDAACSHGVGITHFVELMKKAPTYAAITLSLAFVVYTVIGCHWLSFLRVYTIILLSLLSFSARMTVPPRHAGTRPRSRSSRRRATPSGTTRCAPRGKYLAIWSLIQLATNRIIREY
jgi:hypothetical protein